MPPWLKLIQDAAEWIGLSALWVGVTLRGRVDS
jgi:hypothetical protein